MDEIYDLPEVEITPSELQNYYFLNIRPRLNSKLGMNIAKYFYKKSKTKGREFNDNLFKKFNQIYEYAGSPKVSEEQPILFKQYYSNGNPRPLYRINNKIYNTGTYDSLISELSHPIQFKVGKGIIYEAGKDILKNITGKHELLYSTPGTYEYDAHRIIEPAIKSYITNRNISNINFSDYIKSKYNNYNKN